jgi:hypothetical protein
MESITFYIQEIFLNNAQGKNEKVQYIWDRFQDPLAIFLNASPMLAIKFWISNFQFALKQGYTTTMF